VEETVMETAGGAIEPEKILRELTELWTDMGHGGQKGEAHDGVLRACSMTLLTLTEEQDDVNSLGQTLGQLMPQHPARTIVVRLRGAGERTLSERVYAQCWLPFGQRKQICCEQVEITATDDALADLPPVLLPLTVADLPLVLWCRSPRMLLAPEFGGIAKMADRLIVDSAQIRLFWDFGGRKIDSGPRLALYVLSRIAETGTMLGDLTWTRLTRWREQVAQVFESRGNRTDLQKLEQVSIVTQGEPDVAAFYLGAWVMDSFAAAGAAPKFKVERDGTAPLELRITGPDFRAEVRVEEDRLVSKVNGLENCARMPELTEYALMREELAVMRRDAVFEKTLASAVRLAAGGRR
jgi:glucose-6-phosphate dehydrogenase assembly protein OpcA